MDYEPRSSRLPASENVAVIQQVCILVMEDCHIAIQRRVCKQCIGALTFDGVFGHEESDRNVCTKTAYNGAEALPPGSRMGQVGQSSFLCQTQHCCAPLGSRIPWHSPMRLSAISQDENIAKRNPIWVQRSHRALFQKTHSGSVSSKCGNAGRSVCIPKETTSKAIGVLHFEFNKCISSHQISIPFEHTSFSPKSYQTVWFVV